MKELWQRVQAAWGNLAFRERVLVAGVGILLALTLVWLGAIRPALAASEHMERRVADAEQRLDLMRRLRREFDELNGRLTSVEERIRQGPSGNLRTTLETLAQRSGVKIESMEPQASPVHQRYRETKVELSLKQVSLPQTVRYLHEIEATPQPLSVKALRVRSRVDAPELLDVTFTVSSFEPL